MSPTSTQSATIKAGTQVESVEGSPTDGRIIYVLKSLETGLRPAFEKTVGKHGFTAAQYTAMAVLLSRPKITSSELARRSFVRAQSMAGTISPLVERGLVARSQDPANARRLLLQATPQGHAAVAEVQKDVGALEDRLLAGLNESQLEALSSLLSVLRHNVQGLNRVNPS